MIAATDPESRLQSAATPAVVSQSRTSSESTINRLVRSLQIDVNGVHAEGPKRRRAPPDLYTPPADALSSSSRVAAAQRPRTEARRGQATLAAPLPTAMPAATRSPSPADQPPATAAAATVSMAQLDGRLQEPRASKPTLVADVDLTGISDSDSETDVEDAARPADAKSDTSTLALVPATSASGGQGCPGPTSPPSHGATDARLLAAATAAAAAASTSEGIQREAPLAAGAIIGRPQPAPPQAASVPVPPRVPPASGEGAGRGAPSASSIARGAQGAPSQPGRPAMPHHPAERLGGPGRVAPVTARAARAPQRSSRAVAARPPPTAGAKRRRGQASNLVPADVDADRPADIVKGRPTFKRVPVGSRNGGNSTIGGGSASAKRISDSEGDFYSSHFPSQRSQPSSDSESDVSGATANDSFARRHRGSAAQPSPAPRSAPPEALSPSDSEMPPQALVTIAGGQATGARVESGPLQHLLLHIAASESARGAAAVAPGTVTLAGGARAAAEAPAGTREAAPALLAPAIISGPPEPGLSVHDGGASAPPESAGPDSEPQRCGDRDNGDSDESEQPEELDSAATPPLFADE